MDISDLDEDTRRNGLERYAAMSTTRAVCAHAPAIEHDGALLVFIPDRMAVEHFTSEPVVMVGLDGEPVRRGRCVYFQDAGQRALKAMEVEWAAYLRIEWLDDVIDATLELAATTTA